MLELYVFTDHVAQLFRLNHR